MNIKFVCAIFGQSTDLMVRDKPVCSPRLSDASGTKVESGQLLLTQNNIINYERDEKSLE